MYEVEVKTHINNISKLLNQLAQFGITLSAPIEQWDTILCKIGQPPLAVHAPGRVVLRLREQADRVEFNLKQDRSSELDCLEREVSISERQPMLDILALLDFEPVIEVHKVRQKATFQGLEICVDRVQNLGDFIEIEKLTNDDGETVQEELWQLLERLGVSRTDRVLKGYDTLLAEQALDKHTTPS